MGQLKLNGPRAGGECFFDQVHLEFVFAQLRLAPLTNRIVLIKCRPLGLHCQHPRQPAFVQIDRTVVTGIVVAKDRQGIVNARIAMLKKRIAEISIMNLDKIPHDRAAFGSTVQLREDNGDSITYQLVMPEEADAAKGLISTSSPIGRAIVGKNQGDEIEVTTPSGTRNFEIIKLVTIHDEA